MPDASERACAGARACRRYWQAWPSSTSLWNVLQWCQIYNEPSERFFRFGYGREYDLTRIKAPVVLMSGTILSSMPARIGHTCSDCPQRPALGAYTWVLVLMYLLVIGNTCMHDGRRAVHVGRLPPWVGGLSACGAAAKVYNALAGDALAGECVLNTGARSGRARCRAHTKAVTRP